MPDVTQYTDEKEWMSACVPKMMDEGEDQDQAVAACMTMWREKKSVDAAALEDALKIGARNSRGDAQRLQMIHDYSVDNGARCNPNNDMVNKSIDAETLTVYGAEVKALGDGKIGGYLVMFGSQTQRDLTGVDWFAPDTDFGNADKSAVYYHHGLDNTLKLRSLDDSATLRRDNVGVWIEAQLKMRDEYERAIYGMAQKGKLGWSSGTAPHLVARDEMTGKITRWPLGLDASLTPTPAEPRIKAVPIKSLTTQPLTIETTPETAQENRSAESDHGAAVTSENTSQEITGEPTMSDEALNEIKALLTAQAEKINALETTIKTAPTISTVPAASVQVTIDPADRKFSSVAEQCKAIKAAVKSQGRQYDPRLSRLDAIKAISGSNETVPEDGGYLLEPTISPEVLKPIHDFGMFSSAARPMPVMSTSNSGWINGVDETDLSAGLVWGGVIAYRIAEGNAPTSSKPKFRRINWHLKKYAALVYDTDELLQDAGQFQAVANQACNEAIVFLQNDDIVRGDGAAGCWGILSNGSLVTVTKETNQAADTVVYKNLVKMWQRLLPESRANATWFINSEVEPELDELSIPAGTSALEPRFITYDQTGAMRIKGRPVVVTPFNSALGDAGDIILGDMSAYLMWTKGGIQAAQSIHVEFLTDQNVFRFIARADGQPVLASAITPFKGSNTQSNFVTLGAR